jgi:hypothetical protein
MCSDRVKKNNGIWRILWLLVALGLEEKKRVSKVVMTLLPIPLSYVFTPVLLVMIV